jgi:SAM-dependent methyltransferase
MGAENQNTVFDMQHYALLNAAREAVLRRILPLLARRLVLRTALDAGCGLGHFSGLLANMGFEVTALDARPENLAEGRRRFPGVRFELADAEDPTLPRLGRFDLVLCFGLLYHLENPFRAARNLRALAGSVLLLESMCIPGDRAAFELRDECRGEDQGLDFVALYPTESALVKMLYRAGFGGVHALRPMPDHPDFRSSRDSHRRRTLLVASAAALDFDFLAPLPEPPTSADPWTREWARLRRAPRRLAGSVKKRIFG